MSSSVLRCIASSLKGCRRGLNNSQSGICPHLYLVSSEYSNESLPEDSDNHLQSKENSAEKPKRRVAAKVRKRRKAIKEPKENGGDPQESSNVPPLQWMFPFEGNGVESDQGGKMEQGIEQVVSNGSRHYTIKCPTETYKFPSVTTVLEATMSRDMFFRLHNWRKSLVKEHGEAKSSNITREIKESGINFHKEIEQMLLRGASKKIISIKPHNKTAKHNYKQSDMEQAKQDGTELTEQSVQQGGDMERIQEGGMEQVKQGGMELNRGYMRSVEHVLREISDVCAIESVVSHLELGYTGMFDCLAHFRGELCVIDWKTSGKPKPSLGDCYSYPLQSAAYAGALNQDQHYPYTVTNALIVIAYPNGEPAHTHHLSHRQLLSYWEEWLQRLEQYQTQFATDLSGLNTW